MTSVKAGSDLVCTQGAIFRLLAARRQGDERFRDQCSAGLVELLQGLFCNSVAVLPLQDLASMCELDREMFLASLSEQLTDRRLGQWALQLVNKRPAMETDGDRVATGSQGGHATRPHHHDAMPCTCCILWGGALLVVPGGKNEPLSAFFAPRGTRTC
jgi:hypothetical protein